MGVILVAISVSAFAADERQPAAERPTITVPLTAEKMTRLPSQWPEYFGTHYAGTPEGVGRWWNTFRSYGGTHTGVYATAQNGERVTKLTEWLYQGMGRDGK